YSQEIQIHQKEGVDFTTKADIEVDSFLQEKIRDKFPNTQFLTEETAPSNFLSLRTAEKIWVIDPIDGTINFSRGNSNFAISIALVSYAKPLLGMVYLPLT